MGRRIRVSEWIIFVVIISTSGFLYTQTAKFPLGADVFPRFLTITLIILSLIMMIRTFFRRGKMLEAGGEEAVESDNGGDSDEAVVDKRLKNQSYLVYVFILLLVLVIPQLGFFVSSLIFLPGIMYFLGLRRARTLILPTVIMLILIYILFVQQLNVPLPRGILF